ncbi:MAG: FlxA-like family protein [Massilia sp.]|nr:FlxA-like family protein [Massilia sp.]
MPQAIAPSTTPATASAYGGVKPSPANLQAQLQRYEQQLSDCVNCASAKTPQGKSNIQSIAARISQIRQSIVQIDSGQSARSGGATQAVAPAAFRSAPQASMIDVFA